MKLTITNNANAPVPIMSADGEGYADTLEPSEALSLDNAQILVAIIGNKPSVTEQIEQAFATLAATVRALITAWQNNNNTQSSPAGSRVEVTIENNGTNAVRAILGDGVTDVQVAPGGRWEGQSWGYVELRELGHVDPNITNPVEAA